MAVLIGGFNRCRQEDMQTQEVFAALDYLKARASINWPFDQFRNALNSDNEEGRWQNLKRV
jgi:hypothetical protein